MLLDSFANLKLLSLEFQLSAYQPTSLPNFLGSSLRGAFGQSLKQIGCNLGSANCVEHCKSQIFCPYAYIFETRSRSNVTRSQGQEDVPHPFILIPPSLRPVETLRHFSEGDRLIFGITLIGKACDYLPYVVATIKDVCQKGLGVNRVPFQLSQIAINRDSKKESFSKLLNSYTELPEPDNLKGLIEKRLASFGSLTQLKIEFLTPLRLRTKRDVHIGRNAQAKLNFEMLAINLIRRFSLLSRFHGKELSLGETELFNELLKMTASISINEEEIYWCDIARYSNRQMAKLKLGGLMGKIGFIGEHLGDFLPLLLIGEYLNIGASTTFGFGKIQITA